MITNNPFITSLYKGRIYVVTTNGSKYPYRVYGVSTGPTDGDVEDKLKKYGYFQLDYGLDYEKIYYMFIDYRKLLTLGTAVIDYTQFINGNTFTITGPAAPVTFDATTVTISITDEEKADYAADEFGNDFIIHMNNILKSTPAVGSDSSVGDFCEFFLFDKQQIGLKFKNEYVDPTGVATFTLVDTVGTSLANGLNLTLGVIGITFSAMADDYDAMVGAMPADLQFYLPNTGTTTGPSYSEIFIPGEHVVGLVADVVRYPENFRIR